MKRILFSVLTAGILLFGASLQAAETIDKIVAIVNDDIVTQSELDRNLVPIFQDYRGRFQGEVFIQKMTEARTQILNQMIEDKLVLQEAKKLKVKVSAEEIDRKVLENQKRFRSPDDFQRFLDAQGVTLTTIRDRYSDMILMQRIQAFEVRQKVIVSPTDTEKFYRDNQDKFTSHEAYHVRSITIRKKSPTPDPQKEMALAREKLQGLRKRIVEDHASFEEVARQSSEDTHAQEGGDMGWISKGDFIPQLEDAIFKLKTGEVSPILESDIGYHIFRLEEYRPQSTKRFEEVKDKIQNMLYANKARERFEEWVSKLRKNAYISIR